MLIVVESGFDATDVIQYIMRFYKRLVSVSPYFLSGDLGKLYVIDFENKVRKYEIELATEKENSMETGECFSP